MAYEPVYITSNTKFAIELEVSHSNLGRDELDRRMADNAGFMACGDGSVRGLAREYKPYSPLVGWEGIEMVRQAFSVLEAAGCECDASCGQHIHMDCSEMEVLDFRGMAYAYATMWEPAIFQHLPESRIDSPYCRPTSYRVMADVETVEDFAWIMQECEPTKYHSMNAIGYTAGNRPTIEFRLFPGNTSCEVALAWIDTCARIMTYETDKARQFDHYSDSEARSWFHEALSYGPLVDLWKYLGVKNGRPVRTAPYDLQPIEYRSKKPVECSGNISTIRPRLEQYYYHVARDRVYVWHRSQQAPEFLSWKPVNRGRDRLVHRYRVNQELVNTWNIQPER